MPESDVGSARPGRLFRLVLTLLSAFVLALTGGAIAQAAPPYTTQGTVTNVQFVETTVTAGGSAALTANWSFPNNPTTPAGFTIDLPSGLAGRGDTFTLTAQDSGATIANCVATATQLQCDMDPAYVAANPVNLRGNVNFWVTVTTETTTTTEHTFDFGSNTATVNIQPRPQCTENCDLDWQYRKDGSYIYQNNTIVWYAHVAAPPTGMVGGQDVVVRDTPAGNQTLVVDDSLPRLQRTNVTGPNAAGVEVPSGWQDVPRSEYTVDLDGTIHFTSQAGYFYQVLYITNVTDAGASGTYSNTVEFYINGTLDGTSSRDVRYAGGGGTGIGTNVGVVTIEKAVDGTAVNLPADQLFTGTYSVQPPTGDAITGTWSVASGDTWRSPEFPRDSVVTLTEDAPSEPGNVTWSSAFSTNGFTLPGGQITPVTLTNTADVRLTDFTASKSLSGDAAALVPSDATVTLEYSYPAGTGFAAGEGTIDVPVDGTSVTSPKIPVGAEVTVTERTPNPVAGAAWGTASISPATFTASDSGSTGTHVSVDNPITQQLGGFTLQKTVTGGGAGLVPAGTRFDVDYAWTASGDRSGDGTVTVTAGGDPASVDGIPVGATVTLSEHTPGAIDGITWLDPRFSENGFTVQDGTVVAIDLDNPTELRTGTLSIAKTITGTDAAAALVPADATFTIDYSYPAGNGFAAGSGSLTVSADGTPVTSPALPFGAQVTFTERTPTAVEGLGWGTPVISPATVTIGAGTDVAVTVENPVSETLGGFSLQKSVSGDANGLVPDGTTFTVDYAWTAPDGTTGNGTIDVVAGGDPVEVQGVPGGAVVTLTEHDAAKVDGVKWLDPVFSQNGFTVVAGTTVAIDLDNPTELQHGAFTVKKVVSGSGAVLVPNDTTFTVDYSYPAGEGFEAGSGTLVVAADGTLVQSDPLPYGAVVTLSEATPTAITNGQWTGSSFDTTTVTIGDGTVVGVVLTNTIDDVTPPTPTTPPGLAQTGGEWDAALPLGLAAALLLLGAAAVVNTRRARSSNR